MLRQGEIGFVSPGTGDIHRVANALDDSISISVHVYGGNIGATSRHVYRLNSSSKEKFVSGYSNDLTPNLWDRSL